MFFDVLNKVKRVEAGALSTHFFDKIKLKRDICSKSIKNEIYGLILSKNAGSLNFATEIEAILE